MSNETTKSNPVTKYDLASRLVDREVIYCVSSLMSTLRDAKNHGVPDLQDEDDLDDLFETKDYEEPGREHINDSGTVYLQEAVELFDGDWDEFLVERGMPTDDMLKEAVDTMDELIADMEKQIGELEKIAEITGVESELLVTLRAQLTALEADRAGLPEDLDEWCDAEKDRIEKLRAEVAEYVENNGDWEKLCDENNIDPTYDEVYEHWIVTDWLARKLSSRGYTTGEVCGLTIWGRGCTGQAIALDYVIQQIACELWGDELTETSPSDAF